MSRTILLRIHGDDLWLAPGAECEHVITPQKHATLRRVFVHDVTLVRVQIGRVEVPFKLDGQEGRRRSYRCDGLLSLPQLVATGAALEGHDEIALVAGLNVRLLLRNDQEAPAKSRAALLLEEKS